MLIGIGLIIFYGASVYYAREYIRIAHSEEGRWSNLDINIIDIFFTFMPILNIVSALDYFTGSMYRNNNRQYIIKKIYGLK